MKRINKRINGNKSWMELKMNGKDERNKWRGWMERINEYKNEMNEKYEWKGWMNRWMIRMKGWMKSMNWKDEWIGEW